jgi:HD-GYP domain-containing protein (c-di-GMP phosphodiesterase class II)
MQEDATTMDSDVCQGTLLSRQQYLHDLGELGMKDARLVPEGNMTAEEIDRWTAGIEDTPIAHP